MGTVLARTQGFDFDAVHKAMVAVVRLELLKLRPQKAAGKSANGFVPTATAVLSI